MSAHKAPLAPIPRRDGLARIGVAALIVVLALLGWSSGSVSAGAMTHQPDGGAVHASATSLIPGTPLGGLDLNGYCSSLGYDHSAVVGTTPPGSNLGPNAAYEWACIAAAGSSLPSPYRISRTYGDMYLPCQQQYPGQNAAPLLGDPNDAYTWTCVVGGGSATPPPGAEITGRVCVASEPACPGGGPNGGIDGATVTVCATNVSTSTGTVPFFCLFSLTSGGGFYAIGNLPSALYDVTADPPPLTNSLPVQINNVAVGGSAIITENFSLPDVPAPNPSGIENSFGKPGSPTIDSTWKRYVFDTYGCPGGSFSYSLTLNQTVYTKKKTIPAGTVLASGPMTQISATGGIAHFQATYGQPLAPAHGKSTLTFSFTCPGDITGSSGAIPIYIDPSGTVVNQHGRPISGATVTLYFSPIDASGPFVLVPDGSTMMDPGNRQNPETTGTDGRYGWDALPGFYKVVAARPGCTGPDLTHSQVLTIPPAVTGLTLTLQCTDTTRPEVDLGARPDEQTSDTAARFTFRATDPDNSSGFTYACKLDFGDFAACSSPTTYTALALGPHTFTVHATDPAGNTSANVHYRWVVTPPDGNCRQAGGRQDECGDQQTSHASLP